MDTTGQWEHTPPIIWKRTGQPVMVAGADIILVKVIVKRPTAKTAFCGIIVTGLAFRTGLMLNLFLMTILLPFLYWRIIFAQPMLTGICRFAIQLVYISGKTILINYSGKEKFRN